MRTRIQKGASGRAEWYQKSTDPLPTKAEGAKNADPLYLMDTKQVFLFDEETDSWLEQ